VNVVPRKKFNVVDKGQGFWSKVQNKGDDMKPYSVGLVAIIITREIIHIIRVVDYRFTLLRRHRQLAMLDKLFLGLMRHWIIGRLIIRNLLSIWKVSFVIKFFIFILIGPIYFYSYISPNLVDKCCLNKEVHSDSWLVQLATCTKKIVHHWVRSCEFKFNGMSTSTHLNVLPLGSYSMMLGMDWLYIHKTKMDFYDKDIECLDDDGEKRILQGKKNPTSVRLQLCRKSTILGKDVYFLKFAFLVIKVRMLIMSKY